MANRDARAGPSTAAPYRRLMTQRADDPDAITRITSFVQGLQVLGWTIGRNVEIEYRWTAGDATRARQDAVALAQLNPDVILTNGAAGVTPVLQATRTVPVVFRPGRPDCLYTDIATVAERAAARRSAARRTISR